MVLLPELGALALALFCLAIALAAAIIVTALIRAMGGVPVLGSVIGKILSPVAHALAWAAGQLETGIDAILGATFHSLAKVLEWTFDSYKAMAVALLHTAQLVGGGLYDVSGLRSLVNRLIRAWHGIEHGIRTLTREYHGIDRRVAKLEHELAQGIGNDVRSQVKALEREVATVETKTIPAIRGIADDAVTEVNALQKWIAANVPAVGSTAFVSAIAAALGALGLGWLRCNSNPFTRNPAACGLLSDLARFLPFLGLLALSFDFREFASAAELLAEGIGSAVTSIEGTFELSLPPLPPPA